MGIALITVGAVLRLALSAGSPHGLNVHVVGVILILAGVLGLLLPRLARVPRAPRDRLRRWVYPAMPQAGDKPPTAEDPGVHNYGLTQSEDIFSHQGDPTPADDLLKDERDPPAGRKPPRL